MNNFISYSESIIVFDDVGSVVIVEDKGFISTEVSVIEFSSDGIFYDNDNSDNTENNDLTFLNPSSKTQLAKRCAIELKLRWKVIKGINFSKRFYVNRLRFYKKFLFNMLKSYNIFISLFSFSFEVNFLHIRSFGFEFKSLEIVFNYSGGSFRILYSSLIICFKFLFLEFIVFNEYSIFPNSKVERSFSSIKEFDDFTHLNNLSFTKLGTSIERISGIGGGLVLRSSFGGNLTKLEHRSVVLSREGVKFHVNKFYGIKGVVDKVSSKSIFNESVFYSCYSVSSYYNVIPYKDVLSFNRGGRMAKSCKTFKSPKK